MTTKGCTTCFYGATSSTVDPCKSCKGFDKFVDIRSFQDSLPTARVVEGVKFDGTKPDWALLPFTAVSEVVDVLTFGATKYSPDNWKKVKDAKRRYLAAAFRHIVAHARGEKKDSESGFSHLSHAVCCLLFILELGDSE